MMLTTHQSQSIDDALPKLSLLLSNEGLLKETLASATASNLVAVVREAICNSHQNLEKLGCILCMLPSTAPVGKSILNAYSK